MNRRFYAHGKLLLSAEYFVLEGALALALPTRLGQQLEITPLAETDLLQWESLDADGRSWFTGHFRLPDARYIDGSDPETGRRLEQILQAARRQRPQFLTGGGWKARTRLEFPRKWGLGSSSTLLHLLGQWSQTDPYRLLAKTFGGSGYDIAAAGAGGPFLYRIGDPPVFRPVGFHPSFSHNLFFVYLGRKQDSRAGILRFREKGRPSSGMIDRIDKLSEYLLHCERLSDFADALREHEELVSGYLDLPRAKQLHFADFWGEIKSLGAWGGDFVLATSDRPAEETRLFFHKRGFEVFLTYDQLLLSGENS